VANPHKRSPACHLGRVRVRVGVEVGCNKAGRQFVVFIDNKATRDRNTDNKKISGEERKKKRVKQGCETTGTVK
jgi:hypothetical protein